MAKTMTDCQRAQTLFSSAMDAELTTEEADFFQSHLASCEDCAVAYQQEQALSQGLRHLGMPNLSPGFAERLHVCLLAENRCRRHGLPWHIRPWVASIIAACFLLCFGVFAWTQGLIGGLQGDSLEAVSTENDQLMSTPFLMQAPSSNEDENMIADAEDGSSVEEGQEAVECKTIFYGSFTVEVMDYEEAVQALSVLAEEFGGYVVSNQRYYKEDDSCLQGSVELYIDAANLSMMVEHLSSLGTVIGQTVPQDDITSCYYDLKDRLYQYQIQHDRLLESYEQTENTSELAKLEHELSRVQYQGDELVRSLKDYDQLVVMCSLCVQLKEVGACGGASGDVGDS